MRGAGRLWISVSFGVELCILRGFGVETTKSIYFFKGNQGKVQFGGFGVETSFGVEIAFPSQY